MAGGLITGIILDKLITLILYKILKFSIPLVFEISVNGIIISAILFGAIFMLILLFNFWQLKITKPIELLHGSNAGEKEPKTKALLAVLGVLCLGTAYYIALTTESPLAAMNLFFIAVLLVIAGTFLLFTAGSIALLKLMRKNKKYFYKAKNFTAVSGMIYRMKQNAAGLANICILSTMVLVMISTSVSLYIGVDDALASMYPTDISVTVKDTQTNSSADILKQIEDAVKSHGRTMQNLKQYERLSFNVYRNGNSFEKISSVYDVKRSILIVMDLDNYNKLSGENYSIEKNEVLIYNENEKINEKINILGEEFNVKDTLNSNPFSDDSVASIISTYLIVVSDKFTLNNLCDVQKQVYEADSSTINAYIAFDLDGTDEEIISCYNDISKATRKEVKTTQTNQNGETVESSYFVSYSDCKQELKEGFYAIYGGLLFLGIFLGLLFSMATVLIIYYKQISEGYDDKNRFEIMQKVGMSSEEIRATIKSQVLKVFFIPIAMTGIHILAAFKMIAKVLALLNLTNVSLFAWCTLGCVVVFTIIYAAVYALTARVYYKIVC